MFSSLLLRQRLMATSVLLFFVATAPARVAARQEPKPPEPADLELVISGPSEDFPDRPSQPFHPRKFKVTLINHEVDPTFLPEALVRAGVKFTGLWEDELGLEEVFLRVTRGETQ